MKIKDIVIEGLHDGLTPKEIIARVREHFPEAKTSPASVAWYKSQLNKEGGKATKKAPTVPKKPLAATVEGPAQFDDYEIKGLKTFPTHDGGAFYCSLYRKGRKVAVATQEGRGGPTDIEWLDKDAPRVNGEYRDYKGEMKVRPMTPEERLFYNVFFDWTVLVHDQLLAYNEEMVLDDLIKRYDIIRNIKRWQKKGTAFVNDGAVFTLKAHGKEAEAHILDEHPHAVILNRMELHEAAKFLAEFI